MIIYNVTTKVNETIAKEWLAWMHQAHMPEVMATGCFTQTQILRLLETDDSEGPTYTVQYFAESKADYNRYIALYGDGLRKKTLDCWGNKIIAFRSLMQVVQ